MSVIGQFTLSYEGEESDDHIIDFYDVSQALYGFQRSLALTTHLILNDKVITQAPSLKGARIIALPAEEGSWKFKAIVIAGLIGTYHVTTAPRNTVLGNIVSSAYDYIISESLGFHVDYNSTLGQQYEALSSHQQQQIPLLEQSRLDSVIEKCEPAIKNMHRPIIASGTATTARIYVKRAEQERPLNHPLTRRTYDYINYTEQDNQPEEMIGRVSSYNINTFKGRIFVESENRPLPFELADTARNMRCVGLITQSLNVNARNRSAGVGDINFTAFKNRSRSGQLKSLWITNIGGRVEL